MIKDGLLTTEYVKLPGFTDVHIHLREPGFLYKETVLTGTRAAAAGGFTRIFSMPNLKPCPDCAENLAVQTAAIRKDALIEVLPYGAISRAEQGKELSDMEAISDDVIAFSDDGVGLMSDELMREAMVRARKLGRIVVAHCEDSRYRRDSSEAEWKQLERDLELLRETGGSYHVCHLSTAESVQLIRKAKAEGLDVSCETAPHYLLLTREDAAKAQSGKFKMNPPLKGETDRQALIEALVDGTVDMIATDHAPHSAEEKAGSPEDCAYGIVGLETVFPVLYTELVLKKIISLDRLVELMSKAPEERFCQPCRGRWIKKDSENYSIWNLEDEYTIDPEKFQSKGRSTPFEGWTVKGRCISTVINGKEVWNCNE